MSHCCPNCGHNLNQTPEYLDQAGPTNAMRRALELQSPVMHKSDPELNGSKEVVGERYYVAGREFIKVLGITFCSVQDDQEIPAGFREFRTKTTTIPCLSGLKPSVWESRHAIKGGTKKDMERLCALWSHQYIRYEAI